MTDRLLQWAESRGFQVAWGPVTLLRAVRADLERRRTKGELDGPFARANLAFDFEPQHPGADTWRVVVVVMPRPAHLVAFLGAGPRIDAVMPPTYQRYRPTFEDVRKELASRVLGGATVETLNAPLKSIAARLGLVRYGRNNLAYAPSIGSYLQILGYLTDAELPVEPGWEPREPHLLDECTDCGVCGAVCPTSAIGPDRVLLRAERCLTLANEAAGAWPSWVPASAHHCLIGCLRCQRLCPANPELTTVDTGVVFSEEETTTLLAVGERSGPAWTSIRAKLEALGQPYQEEVMGRTTCRCCFRQSGAARTARMTAVGSTAGSQDGVHRRARGASGGKGGWANRWSGRPDSRRVGRACVSAACRRRTGTCSS